MKTDVEELSPTRVKLSVAVPFDELKPSIDKAYREVARRISVPGFRPGRVPPPVIDKRIGRGPVLEQAVNEAIPGFYGKAIEEHEVFVLGRPEVEITRLNDGEELSFTAEVDIRPRFELPTLGELTVTIDDATVTPDDVEEYLGALRERFASLKGVQRPVAGGDYVSIDLSATADGEPVEDAQTSGLSYEVGSGSIFDGLDDALTGMSAGESKTFSAALPGGARAGERADITATVHSVKVKELPGLDDEFAQLASEFDTIGELRADSRKRLEQIKRTQQVVQARDRAVEALLAKLDIPLPESVVAEEAEGIRRSMHEQIQRSGSNWAAYLEAVGKSEEELSAEVDGRASRSVKTSLILDALVRQEDIRIDEAELSYFLSQQAERMGVDPGRLARQLAESGQLTSVAAEVLRGKAIALLAERVKTRDESGNEIDYKAITHQAGEASESDEASEPGEPGEPDSAAEDSAAKDSAAEDGAAEDSAAEKGEA